jgi:uroporphyrin-III C-methyltransferase/precorrin-2 dehydrogenase/sirohydrochlorin ferrochelatase
MSQFLPLFLNLAGRDVVLVGGGPVAAAKLRQLLAVGARVRVIAPEVTGAIEDADVAIARREFVPDDLDGAWLVIAAAPPDVNRQVAAAAEARRMFVNAVDDPANATAFLTGVVRRSDVTMAISSDGHAPALTALLREALDAVLPGDLDAWLAEARRQRAMWRRDQVPMASRKPLLLEALNRLYERDRGQTTRPEDRAPVVQPPAPRSMDAPESMARGHVSLVGAGPGDPGLLTRTAIARLRAADLVLYDALIDERILRYARHAQRFFVGKRAGRHAITQETIHGVMIRATRRGRRVVRLKGGDPFVFGRGGEEALALQRAGVSFDVVPGITSAIAAPELAGIPVTHRGVSSAFLVVSGHDESAFADAVGQVRANGMTLVVLMGIGRSAAIAATLVDAGWAPATPAAIVVDASRPGQHVWRGTLGELRRDEIDIKIDGAGTIVIGDVVALEATVQAGDRPVLDARARYGATASASGGSP